MTRRYDQSKTAGKATLIAEEAYKTAAQLTRRHRNGEYGKKGRNVVMGPFLDDAGGSA